MLGPEMAATGTVLDGDPPLIPANSIGLKTPAEGRAAVRAQAKADADEIKIYSRLDKQTFPAILNEASTPGLKAAEHVPDSVYIKDAPTVFTFKVGTNIRTFQHQDYSGSEYISPAVLLRYYPAATEVFGELSAQIALRFVQEYPTPQAAASLTWDGFMAFAQRHHHTQTQRLPDRFARLQRLRPEEPNPVARLTYASEGTHVARLALDLV